MSCIRERKMGVAFVNVYMSAWMHIQNNVTDNLLVTQISRIIIAITCSIPGYFCSSSIRWLLSKFVQQLLELLCKRQTNYVGITEVLMSTENNVSYLLHCSMTRKKTREFQSNLFLMCLYTQDADVLISTLTVLCSYLARTG